MSCFENVAKMQLLYCILKMFSLCMCLTTDCLVSNQWMGSILFGIN